MSKTPAPLERIAAVEDLVRQGVGIARACWQEGVSLDDYYARRQELSLKPARPPEVDMPKGTRISDDEIRAWHKEYIVGRGMTITQASNALRRQPTWLSSRFRALGLTSPKFNRPKAEERANGKVNTEERSAVARDILGYSERKETKGKQETMALPAGWGQIETGVAEPLGRGSEYIPIAEKLLAVASHEWARIRPPDEKSLDNLRKVMKRLQPGLEIHQAKKPDGLYLYWRLSANGQGEG